MMSCKENNQNKHQKPVARALDKYLYVSDLSEVIPSGISQSDSASMAADFVDKWIRNQLLLSKAEVNLTEEEKQVEQQIENYRSSLLIYAYEQSYLKQKLDTVVPDTEIIDYYNQNTSNYVLNENLFKGHFIKVPATAPEIYKLRQWSRSDDPESIKNLESYCFNYAAKYDHFDENWTNLDDLLHQLPVRLSYLSSYIQTRKYYETRDSFFYYFITAKEFAPSGSIKPIELVKEDIKSIILNKRKMKLINELESNIYNDAQNRGQFTIYE
jgi:hypothetical protein